MAFELARCLLIQVDVAVHRGGEPVLAFPRPSSVRERRLVVEDGGKGGAGDDVTT